MSLPTPGTPSNPSIIVGDSSALLPLILAEELKTLRALESSYGIICAVMPAVESELLWRIKRKFPDRSGTLKKALANGTIKVIDESLLSGAGYLSASALIDQIDQLGLKYASRIDRGEAYTHAAGNILELPTLSQDLTALWRLVDSGIRVHRPILRAFDVVILGLQIGVLNHGDCKDIRKELLKRGETIPSCFQNCSVIDGLPRFYQRLCDTNAPVLGAQAPSDKFDDRIWITGK